MELNGHESTVALRKEDLYHKHGLSEHRNEEKSAATVLFVLSVLVSAPRHSSLLCYWPKDSEANKLEVEDRDKVLSASTRSRGGLNF